MYGSRRSRIQNPRAYAAAVARNAVAAKSYRSYRSAPRARYSRAAPRGRASNYQAPPPVSRSGSLFGTLGSAAGGILGNVLGGFLGFKKPRSAVMRSRMSRNRGYHANDQRAPRGRVPQRMPRQMKAGTIESGGSSSTRYTIPFREFIAPVFAQQKFTNTVYPINPGLTSTFPWLSGVAQQFEQYEVHDMCFEYVTTSVDALNSINTALGTVAMTTEYNVLNDPFINQQQFENNVNTTVTKPSMSAIHCVETRSFQTPVETLNVRLGVPSSGDLRLYDLGNFQLMVTGMQDHNFQIGQLFVSYSISFFKPKLSSGLNLGGQTAQFLINPLSSVGGITDASPLGPIIGTGQPGYLTLFNEAGIELLASGGRITDTIQFPLGANGLYRYTYRVHTYNTAPTSFSGVLASGPLIYTNCSRTTIWQDYTFSSINNIGSGVPLAITTQDCDWIFSEVVSIDDPSQIASIRFPLSTSIFVFGPTDGNGTMGDLIIGQINGNLPLAPALALTSSAGKSLATKQYYSDLEAMVEHLLKRREGISQRKSVDFVTAPKQIKGPVSSASEGTYRDCDGDESEYELAKAAVRVTVGSQKRSHSKGRR